MPIDLAAWKRNDTDGLFSAATGRSSASAEAPPPFTPQGEQAGIELVTYNANSSTASLGAPDSGLDGPPPYSADTNFTPTLQFQIQTPGKSWLSLPLPPRPDPIPVFTLGPSGAAGAPAYISVRQTRGSGTCSLVRADDPELRPLSTTTYRFGPGKPPRVRLRSPNAPPPADGDDGGNSDDEIPGSAAWDDFELVGKGLLTRAVGFRTRLGSFEWRYAGRKERKAAGGVNSLLVLDKVVRVFRSAAGGGGKPDEEEVRTPVARLVRCEAFRSPGSSAGSAGNGGRLLMDLGHWAEGNGGKEDAEMMQVLVVTTCISMLKKEVDRRRAQQIAIMAGAASGGGP